MKLSNSFIKLIFFHYAGLLLFGEATSIAVDETARKDLFFCSGESHTEFQADKQVSKCSRYQ